MNFTKEFTKNAIWVDFGEEIMYGEDQAYINYPVSFPTVNFYLHDTNELITIADNMRKEKGFLPFFDDSGEYDWDGWYNFYIGINGFSKTKLDTSIMFTVASETQSDDNETYYIDLSEEEQLIIYAELDKQCRKNLQKSCDELLEEAREEMIFND